MTKRVQLLRHAAEVANQFLGLMGELTADYDNNELRLHDGTTEGGARFLNRDANDDRYQARSDELDGLLGWEPNERGFLARLGTSTYRLRRILVNENQLTIENPLGYAGNPTFGISATIATDHTFSGEVTFTQPILATGGVVGGLIGNVVGNLAGNVTGNVAGDLFGDADGNHTGSFVGNVDTRGSTLLMDAGQIQLPWLSQQIVDFVTDAGVPIGTIVAFGLPANQIPVNWFICDGTNGTPDLRERFVVGVSGTLTLDSAGGATAHSHSLTIESGGAHVHTGAADPHALTIAEMPAHYHGNGVTNTDDDLYCYGSMASPVSTPDSIDDNSSNGTLQGLTQEIGDGNGHSHTLTVDNGGAHSHTATAAAGSSLPPYYALYYIMKGA